MLAPLIFHSCPHRYFFKTYDQTVVFVYASQLLLYDPFIYKHMDGVWRAFFIRLVPLQIHSESTGRDSEDLSFLFLPWGVAPREVRTMCCGGPEVFCEHILLCHPISDVCACISSHSYCTCGDVQLFWYVLCMCVEERF